MSKFDERCFIYAGPGTLYLIASSSLLTLIDLNSFSSIIYFVCFMAFVSAPGEFLSRALQVRCVFVFVSCSSCFIYVIDWLID